MSRGDATRFHPGFIDLTGQVLAGCTVLRRTPNVEGNARWRCTMACGHEETHQGIKLRAAEKAGTKAVCADCRPKRPGTVKRVPRITKRERYAREAARRKALAPGNKGRGSKVCTRCGSIPQRVICSDGPNCQKCGLAYAPDAPIRADGEARRALP